MNDPPLTTEQIWELLGAQLKNFMKKRVADEQLAEDLLQETFLRIHKGLDTIGDSQRLTAWVFQIARNLLIDHYRAQARQATAAVEDWTIASDAEDNIDELVIGWLPQMIAQLPARYRDAVELYEFKGVPQKEIAAQLGLSLSGAKSRIQRGRDQLKALLHQCCSFERDRRGNLVDYAPNDPDFCADDTC